MTANLTIAIAVTKTIPTFAITTSIANTIFFSVTTSVTKQAITIEI
jgi:hypothetical protein